MQGKKAFDCCVIHYSVEVKHKPKHSCLWLITLRCAFEQFNLIGYLPFPDRVSKGLLRASQLTLFVKTENEKLNFPIFSLFLSEEHLNPKYVARRNFTYLSNKTAINVVL